MLLESKLDVVMDAFNFSWNRSVVDSREVNPGDLFFALQGEKTDGHLFLEEVASKNAAAAVVSQEFQGCQKGLKLIRVQDPLETLQTLAKEKLARSTSIVVGITGSIGKTTTKTFLFALLKERFRVVCSPGNYNSQVGLPLTILNYTDGSEEVLILEMGMTGSGEISRLVHIAPPTIAVITAIDEVHIENFSSLEGIARAKGEIFSHPFTKLGIFPETLPFQEIITHIGSCKKEPYPLEKTQIPVLGRHNIHNFSAAAAVAKALGMTEKEIEERIPHLALPEKRLELVEKGGVLFVNDSYNACVTSMKGALDSLPLPAKGGKRIAVLGGMVNLGSRSPPSHREVGLYALDKVDLLICLHESCKPMVEVWEKEGRDVQLFMTLEPLIQSLKRLTEQGDVVLLKGSNLRSLWKVLEVF